MRIRRRGGDFRRVEDVAAAAGSLLPNLRQGRHLVALAAWRSAVGEPIHRVTRVERLDSGILTVAVSDPAWRDSLRALEGSILSRVRGRLGREAPRKIEFLVSPECWRPGRRPTPSTRAGTGPASGPPSGPGLVRGGASTGAGADRRLSSVPPDDPLRERDLQVADPRLRGALCRIANRYLRRGEERMSSTSTGAGAVTSRPGRRFP